MRIALLAATCVAVSGAAAAAHPVIPDVTPAVAGTHAAVSAPRTVSPVAVAPVAERRAVPEPAPLVEAARAGDMAKVKALLADGADVNSASGDGMTALHWASHLGDTALVALLLKSGASLTATTRLGDNTPLHVASRQGNGAVVRQLLQAGAKPDVPTVGGATALHLAAASGDSVAIGALIKAGANPNARENAWQQTPLMFAAAADRVIAVRALIAGKADPSLKTSVVDLSARTAREQAAAKKRNEVLFSMLPQAQKDSILKSQAPAPKAADTTAKNDPKPDPAAKNASDAKSAIAIALPAKAAPEAASEPKGYVASVNAPPTDQLTAAQIQMAIDSARVVLDATGEGTGEVQSDTTDGQVAGFEGTVGGMGGFGALHHAVRQGNIAATIALLDGGADINQVTGADSTTPLLLATINGQFDLAKLLVERGADVRIASTAGATPLYAAINTQWLPRSRFPQPQAIQVQKTTHLELMEAMIAAGADVNVRLTKNLWYFAFNNCGNANCGLEYLDQTTPFWRAAYAVDVDAMRMLKSHGAIDTLPSHRTAPPRRRPGEGAGGDGLSAGPPSAAPATGAAGLGAPTVAPADPDVFARLAAQRAERAAAAPPKLDPAIDSAAKAVPPGIGVYPIHAAAGVGYGNGFAGNSHRHAPGGWMPAMRYLVEELGADVNARDNNGATPLHHAAARGDNEMILYLVSKGADVRAVTRRGQTTVDLANGPVQRLRPFPETIALLESLGATNSHKCVSC